MTLVLGLQLGERVQLLSDTRISHPDVTQIEEIPGRLKIILINADIAVAYAGSADYAIDIIRGAQSDASLGQVLNYLHESHVASRNSVDFLVASASSATLFSIREGVVEPVHRECWIGDETAFDAYTRQPVDSRALAAVRAAPNLPIEAERLVRALGAFGKVLENPQFPSVSGLMVSARSEPQGFRYVPYAAGYYPSQTIPSGVSTVLSFGGRAEGGFSYTLMIPNAPGISLLAVHFVQGALGFIYAPLLEDRPIQVSNVSHEGLKAEVMERFGVAVDGLRFG